MKLWKDLWKQSEHVALRLVLMMIFFTAGIVLLVVGWHMTGQLSGLGLMMIGIVLLLTTLFVYNKPFNT